MSFFNNLMRNSEKMRRRGWVKRGREKFVIITVISFSNINIFWVTFFLSFAFRYKKKNISRGEWSKKKQKFLLFYLIWICVNFSIDETKIISSCHWWKISISVGNTDKTKVCCQKKRMIDFLSDAHPQSIIRLE